LTAWRAQKRLKPFEARIGSGTRLKPGVNENASSQKLSCSYFGAPVILGLQTRRFALKV
jgi:hypothetical protein